MANQNAIQRDSYDRNMIPAEIAARRDREGDDYKQLPNLNPDAGQESIDTTGGYTVDERGLSNNYAVEPEMYVEEPGDLREKNDAIADRRAQRLGNIQDSDRDGLLTADGDNRGRGPGVF